MTNYLLEIGLEEIPEFLASQRIHMSFVTYGI